MKGLVAKAEIEIAAPAAKVWDALVDPAKIKKYFFGADVRTDWAVGSAITWSGVWQGKPYEDKGEILKNEEHRLLEMTHFSPLMGKPDAPEHYHRIRIELEEKDGKTTVTLIQDNNATEEARAHSEGSWKLMLGALKHEAES